VVPFLQPAVTTMTVKTIGTDDGKGQLGEYAPRIQNRSTQTDYRESETQTTPWAPPMFTHCTPTPEVLTLGSLSWGVYNVTPFFFHGIITIIFVMDKKSPPKDILSGQFFNSSH
jgi:hypothetical protein